MKKQKEVTIPEISKIITEYYCDCCGEKASYMRPCYICGGDTCNKCSIRTDSDHLSPYDYYGDYPDYYCVNCWEKGEEIIQSIKVLREAFDEIEVELWERWRELSKDKKAG